MYAPTSDYSDETVEEMYEDVSKAMKESKANYTIVLGDFIVKVGKRLPGEESIMGMYGVGDRNRRGEMLLDFVTQQETHSSRRRKTKYWTRESSVWKH